MYSCCTQLKLRRAAFSFLNSLTQTASKQSINHLVPSLSGAILIYKKPSSVNIDLSAWQKGVVDLLEDCYYLRPTLNFKVKKFVTIRLFKTFKQVAYYTFLVEGREHSEADAFFTRFENELALANDLNLLVAWIEEIGQNRGAQNRYFRFENAAAALPPPARIMAELGNSYCLFRLYCVRLSDEVVILANGGRKTSQVVQNSPELITHFRFANKMAQQLIELIQSGELMLDGKQIVDVETIELLD